MDFQNTDALIVVDVQNDFCPGGALGVPRGDEVVTVLNEWIKKFKERGLPIVYTQDWHPEDHISFNKRGGPWPDHCVQGSAGASFHPDLIVEGVIFRKGFDPEKEAYSGFDGYLVRDDGSIDENTSLATWLKQQGVKRIFVGGLTTDYCVRATVLDGLKNGFQVQVLTAACRPVDVNPGDGERALSEMQAAGARLAS